MSSDAGVKWRPGLAGASLAVLIAVLVVTGLGVWAVSADVHHQEHTALTQRSSEYAVVLSNRLSEVESALSVLGQISPETPQSQNIFYEAARSQVSGTTRFIAVAKPQAQGYVVVAAVGQGLPVGSHLVGARWPSAALARPAWSRRSCTRAAPPGTTSPSPPTVASASCCGSPRSRLTSRRTRCEDTRSATSTSPSTRRRHRTRPT
jgi:hypothetical protein